MHNTLVHVLVEKILMTNGIIIPLCCDTHANVHTVLCKCILVILVKSCDHFVPNDPASAIISL